MGGKTGRAAMLIVAMLGADMALAQQYRENMPEVLRAPPPPPGAAQMGAATAGAFRAAYARRKSPRMVIFWNRQLTDSLSTSYEEWSRFTLVDGRAVDKTYYDDGSVVTGARVVDAELRSGRAAATADGARATGLPERADWRAAQGFNRALLAGGARLIDRTLIMRSTALQKGVDRGDTQAVEMSALMGKADLLVEVLQTPDPGAPSGYTFRVDVKDIRSGTLLATVVTQGVPPSGGPGRFVAGPNGYERERPLPPTIDQVGARVASEIMQALVANWG
ncbi:hypothetical protein [Rhizorhabdus dicambivorans]|uniref:Lipoprotein n=1 Tax=Rhizorhabdus dicambivorans TaxID=1850238 RepID=A0A2A4FTV2_9SPHN|nr:hypothetical protein [Rhizorhabdus dicambivorans]ATE64513.1 hypothetical protein CMV14_08960 [Rhizorhabdus dicambivorans]PCE41607.1 hypothetical protein COO09_13890 [Rhizorhabdus dicambivorans]